MIVVGRKIVTGFASLGALSGAIATGLLMTLPDHWKFESADLFFLSPLSIAAGLVFGVIFGAVLRYLNLANSRAAVLYAAASTLSYFVAVNLAFHLVDIIGAAWLLGAIVGFAGAACLTAAAMGLFPFARRTRPAALMLVAGGLRGVLLEMPVRSNGGGFMEWLILFVPWQAGYAAAFATALPLAVEK
jgi:hypothetical protein